MKKSPEPVEAQELQRQVGVGAAVISGLVTKGLLKKTQQRIQKPLITFEPRTSEPGGPDSVVNLPPA